MAALVLRWARLYTAGLPAPAAHRRVEEITADVHDHITHQRSLGVADSRIARDIASRAIRGAGADIAWRHHQNRTARRRSTKERTTDNAPFTRSAIRITAFVLGILAIPLVGMTLSDDVAWSLADFVLAGVLLGMIGVCFEAAARRRGNLLIGGGVAGLGVVAAVVGDLDDAPGLVLIGLLLIAGGATLAYRRLHASPST